MSECKSNSESELRGWDRIKMKYWERDWDVDRMIAATETTTRSDNPSDCDE